MQESFEKVRAYYQQFDEWSRLDSPSGLIEKREVIEIVKSYIPKGAHILDLGAGPGRYALEFARLGYALSLIDLSERLIDIAKEKFAASDFSDAVHLIEAGNATNLEHLASNSFDAVFCNGPFYHIIDEHSRLNAAREALRVCKPDGILMIGFVPKFSGLAGLIFRAAHREGQVDSAVFRDAAESGVFHNSSGEGFQEGYYPTVKEFKQFWLELGLQQIEVISTRSFMHQNEQHVLTVEQNDPELYQTIIQTHRALARSEAFVEAGGHALLVGKKP